MQQLPCLLPRLIRRVFPHLRRGQHDVLDHCAVRKQIELLKDHPHLGSDIVNPCAFGHQGSAFNDNIARLRLLQQIQAAQKSRFARARRPDDYHNLAAANVNADIRQYLMGTE